MILRGGIRLRNHIRFSTGDSQYSGGYQYDWNPNPFLINAMVGGEGIDPVTHQIYNYYVFKDNGSINVGRTVNSADYLLIGAGGSGGVSNNARRGGGGAGDVVASERQDNVPISLVNGTYTVEIGEDGGGSMGGSTTILDSTMQTIIQAIGGGRGGHASSPSGENGGSGGGAGVSSVTSGIGGDPIGIGYGNVGGSTDHTISATRGGGGGGAGGTGSNANTATIYGKGGVGLSFDDIWSGVNGKIHLNLPFDRFAGGGGGSNGSGDNAAGSDGGGSLGSNKDGKPNTGAGGGANTATVSYGPGKGGSGLCIIRTPITRNQKIQNILNNYFSSQQLYQIDQPVNQRMLLAILQNIINVQILNNQLQDYMIAGKQNYAEPFTPESKKHLHKLIKQLKIHGIWDKLSALYVAGHDQKSSLVNLIKPSIVAQAVGASASSISFTENLGWTGYANAALDLQINLSSDTKYTDGQGTLGLFATQTNVFDSNYHYLIGSREADGIKVNMLGYYKTGSADKQLIYGMYRGATGTSSNHVATGQLSGLFCVSINNVDGNGVYNATINNVVEGDEVNEASYGVDRLYNSNVYGLNINSAGSPTNTYNQKNGKIGAFIIGAALTHGENSQTANLYNALNRYFKAIGVNPVWQQ